MQTSVDLPMNPEIARNEAMRELLGKHRKNMGAIALHHEFEVAVLDEAYDKHLKRANSATAEPLFIMMERAVGASLQTTQDWVEAEIQSTAGDLFGMLSLQERQLLQATGEYRQSSGPKKSQLAQTTLLEPANPDVQNAINTILDAEVMDTAKTRVGHSDFESILLQASSETARQAIKAGLGRDMLQAEVPHSASSKIVQHVMRSALDAQLLRQVKRQIKIAGMRHTSVERLINTASSERAQILMRELIHEETIPAHQRTFGFPDVTAENILQSFSATLEALSGDMQSEEAFSAEAIMDREAQRIRDKTAALRGDLWLARVDLADIRYIVTTVDDARQQAASQGRTLSTREIILLFRGPAQEAEINRDTVSPYHYLSRIVLALRDNNGDFPF